MNHVSTAKAKSYSRIYFDDKDAEVESLVAAAEEFVARFLNYSDLSHADLLLAPDSPPPDSPGAQTLKPLLELLVLMKFDENWQNRGIQVIGSSVTENPEWMRAAHLYRRDLGV